MVVNKDFVKNSLSYLGNAVSEVISNEDFISRTVGMGGSYDAIIGIAQSLGREPVSLLGKDYLFIFDHVRRNCQQGTYVPSPNFVDCPKFTFYKEAPTVRFADPYSDPVNLIDRWFPDVNFETTITENVSLHYAESNDGYTNNKNIGHVYANGGVAHGEVYSYGPKVKTCDLIGKTNQNFNHGKYETLVARFHTNTEASRSLTDPIQTANITAYGLSHGRNLLKVTPTTENGYDNPYCRVWTYHHQYNQLTKAIRPFSEANSKEGLEDVEKGGAYRTVGFRTEEKEGFDGGSKRLDEYGVLDYDNNMVNIAPTLKLTDYFGNKANNPNNDDKRVGIKKCMFSIENLAWRDSKMSKNSFDIFGLSPEQKGPLGGRIMWFPPYDISFNETVSVDWNPNKFIGRGENVYTYTNTERTGHLGFTLVIDHPAILDYWTGHERNGRTNRGKSLLEGNSFGRQGEINNQEQTLLRFFAGCDILSAKPHILEEDTGVAEPAEPEPAAPTVTPAEVAKPVHKTLYCVLYYPNNYSGCDDRNFTGNSDGKVNAIDYLMNGIGTQKYVDDSGYAVDFPISVTENVFVDGYPYTGGYEVRLNGGISVAAGVLNKDINTIEKTYAKPQDRESGQYLTSSIGEAFEAKYGEESTTSYKLAKQIGSEVMSLDNARGKYNGGVSSYVANSPFIWCYKRWYYRVDNVTANEELHCPRESVGQVNYIDNSSYQYNSVGYLSQKEKLKTEFDIKLDDDDKKLISFCDLYVGLMQKRESGVREVFDGLYDDDNIKKYVLPFVDENNKDKIKVTKVTFHGHASVQGQKGGEKRTSKKTNTRLATERQETFKLWLSSMGFPGIKDAQVTDTETKVQNGGNYLDVNDAITKMWRSAHIEIEYDEYDVAEAVTAEPTTETDKEKNSDNSTNTGGQKGKRKINGAKVGTDNTGGVPDMTRTGNAILAAINSVKEEGDKGVLQNEHAWQDFKNKEWLSENGSISNLTTSFGDIPDVAIPSQKLQEINDKVKDTDIKDSQQKKVVPRYDNEGEFFERLTKDSPFLHHLITEKIKYFDPAFHSISPEGFNARLTFLHQCTRQGSTVEASSFEGGTAYNLSFGRPPVCVLRLGDFYNTKIIIRGVTINYEQPQWDLNPEGIGVMPMFAKIDLDFVFLGGSDIAGPISRLQNAVSFNYYANTSVYDNRAEMVKYDDKGNEVAFYPFTYPGKVSTTSKQVEDKNKSEK